MAFLHAQEDSAFGEDAEVTAARREERRIHLREVPDGIRNWRGIPRTGKGRRNAVGAYFFFFFDFTDFAGLAVFFFTVAFFLAFLGARFFAFGLERAFCTALALAASEPKVVPMDSATLVRRASSLVGSWVSAVVKVVLLICFNKSREKGRRHARRRHHSTNGSPVVTQRLKMTK
jgi:hypothetical protein